MMLRFARRRVREEGFTLFEMLAVLAIIAGIGALTLPNVWRKPADFDVRTTALDMAAMLRAVRADAINRNGERTFTIDTSTRTYWSDIFPAPRAIPASVAIEAELPTRGRLSATAGRYTFHPDGTASAGRIVLVEGEMAAEVIINGLTGNAEIKWKR